MKLNQLIAQALNKPVEELTIEDVIKALHMEVDTKIPNSAMPMNLRKAYPILRP